MSNEVYIGMAILQISQKLEQESAKEVDLDSEIDQLFASMPFAPDLTEDDRDRIRRGVEEKSNFRTAHREAGATLIPISMVMDPELHVEWYDDWIKYNDSIAGRYHWCRLEDFLTQELSRKYGPSEAGKVVRSIDTATDRIMGLMPDPGRKEFDFKGMVLGYVQSGKTANFTGLIAKAADAGYRLIVVFSGIHNNLREQTQVRLDKELTGVKEFESTEVFVSKPKAAANWERLTNSTFDFSTGHTSLFSQACQSPGPVLAVTKKNVKVMDKFIAYLAAATPEERANMPLLVIDDEADQASIDTNANDPDTDPSKTNAKIRELLELFPRRTYIGYTATPFANVLIDVENKDDLYPKNFIVALPRPDEYFGSDILFRGDLADRYIRKIDDSKEWINDPTPPEELERAVREFLMGCAVRTLRGDGEKPMSMLVHIDHKTNVQHAVWKLLDDHMKGLRKTLGDSIARQRIKPSFEKHWEKFSANCSAIQDDLHDCRPTFNGNAMPTFKEVWDLMSDMAEKIEVLELNSSSDDSLDYTKRKGIKAIAVGGNKLSRGLTLEGLQVSFFLRDSKQYDTILQMGRWFGYRSGYEDLTRVFTSHRIADSFVHLAGVELQIRAEISRYEEEGKTPKELSVMIRDHARLRVTSPKKMGRGTTLQSSFSNGLTSTIWVPLDNKGILDRNLDLTSAFVTDLHRNHGGFSLSTKQGATGVHLLNQKVRGHQVRNFIERFGMVTPAQTGGPGLDKEGMMDYIDRRLADAECTDWSVAVAGPATAKHGSEHLGPISVHRIQRSRFVEPTGFNIGALTDKHTLVDLPDGATKNDRTATNPLLLIYVVDKDSKARTSTSGRKQRVDLFDGIADTHRQHVVGLGFVFPKSLKEPENFIGQDI